MEYLAFEKGAYEALMEKFSKLKKHVDELYPANQNALERGWIENVELSRRLNISLRTLQTYRERGVLGFSMIGRKVYYKVSEVEKLLADSHVGMKNKSNKKK